MTFFQFRMVMDVMTYKIILEDNSGIPVMDDNISYLNNSDAEAQLEVYDEWFVQQVQILDVETVAVLLCQKEEA